MQQRISRRTWVQMLAGVAMAGTRVGVLTAVLGGGYLLWLMHRGRGAKGAV